MYTDQKDHETCVRRVFFLFRYLIFLYRFGFAVLTLFKHVDVKTWSPLHYRRSQSAFPFGNTMRVNPVFENDDGVLTHVSSILCPMSSDSASLQQSGQGTFRTRESRQLSIEVKCTTKMVFLMIYLFKSMSWPLLTSIINPFLINPLVLFEKKKKCFEF